MKPATPILRIFDEEKAREFYGEFLGFSTDWEHRYEEDSPVYMQVSRESCVLHLTGHHGDACPGAAVRIETPGLDVYCETLRDKQYRHARPGQPQETPWGTREITITDPFGNCLTLFETARKPS